MIKLQRNITFGFNVQTKENNLFHTFGCQFFFFLFFELRLRFPFLHVHFSFLLRRFPRLTLLHFLLLHGFLFFLILFLLSLLTLASTSKSNSDSFKSLSLSATKGLNYIHFET